MSGSRPESRTESVPGSRPESRSENCDFTATPAARKSGTNAARAKSTSNKSGGNPMDSLADVICHFEKDKAAQLEAKSNAVTEKEKRLLITAEFENKRLAVEDKRLAVEDRKLSLQEKQIEMQADLMKQQGEALKQQSEMLMMLMEKLEKKE